MFYRVLTVLFHKYYSLIYLCKQYDNMRNTQSLFSFDEKRKIDLLRSESGNSWNPMMSHCSSLIAREVRTDSQQPFTPTPRGSSHFMVPFLSPSCCSLAHGPKGVFHNTSFDTNYRHTIKAPNFDRVFMENIFLLYNFVRWAHLKKIDHACKIKVIVVSKSKFWFWNS